MATVLGHHPAFYMGACYTGPFEVSEYDIMGAYLREPLRVTPSTTWGEDLLIPADAEIVIEGALIPGKRIVDGPFGEAPGLSRPPALLLGLPLRGTRHQLPQQRHVPIGHHARG